MAAIKTAKTYVQIGLGLEAFKEAFPVEEIPFMLMGAIGASPTILQRYREGKSTVASFEGLLIKNVLAYRLVRTVDMNAQLEEMKRDKWVVKNRPAILAVSDGEVIKAFDPAVEETYENHLNNLFTDYEFFSPMWGVRKMRNIEENDADVKAAYKMAQIHDEIRRYNQIGITADTHDLNVFMSRLLFCFFAEDTGIFEKDLFTNAINGTTRPDSSDLAEFFEGAFLAMMMQQHLGVNSRFAQFPYVNGGLFTKHITIPRMNARIRKLILECGNLNWAKINPDIFGSMIQAVVNPELRSGLGMHYTSVSNIKKVINPLFLDELYEEYKDLERKQKEQDAIFDQSKEGRDKYYGSCKPLLRQCQRLLARMKRMKFFDPACGSGNFLIIAYKELRLLEMKMLKLMQAMSPDVQMQFVDGSIISINQFYGLEINDFACETAVLSMWLAEHQMNSLFMKDFGVNIKALPLKSNTNFHCGNACREDWNKICPHTPDEEVYVMGNPPYLGSAWQNKTQKEDMALVFKGFDNYKNLDYIACWFYKGGKYIENTNATCAFVSTNSICQGEQVSMLWRPMLKKNIYISFAYHSFKWSNNAKYNAGVSCVIVGLASNKKTSIKLYSENQIRIVSHLNGYLLEAPDISIGRLPSPISELPPICKGSMARDDGNLLLDEYEKDELLQNYPQVARAIKPFIGAAEYLRSINRYCLWMNEDDYKEFKDIPEIARRLENVSKFRAESDAPSTQAYAARPYLFVQRTYKEEDFVYIPQVTSERREYVPISLIRSGTVTSDKAFSVYGGGIHVMGILSSKMHIIWFKTFGGRLKTDYSYSSNMCYNSFPFPCLTEAKKLEIEDAAYEVLGAREAHYGKTLAELYDPEKMPADLREAHHQLDLLVDSCYRDRPFADENERLEWLLKLYEKMKKNG